MAAKKTAKKSTNKGATDSLMDKSGGKPAAGYMADQAEEDRTDAKAAKLEKGLAAVKDMAAQMAKGIAHGIATDSDEMMAAVLDEVAALGNAIRDRARKALRDYKAPAKNVQPS
jgi:hypothetical protein